MGKASRSKRDRTPEDRTRIENYRTLDAYLNKAGALSPATADQYWNQLESSHGTDFVNMLIALLNERGAGNRASNIYDVINRDLDTTQATFPLIAPMARVWLTQFTSMNTPTGDVLDLGCGSGLFTCWYAKQRPDSRVIGVDANPAAVARARELAQFFGLANVEIMEGDIAHLDLQRSFPLVVSTLALVEIDDVTRAHGGFSTTAEARKAMEDATSRLALAAQKHVAPRGQYVTVERLPTFHEHAYWFGALEGVGLHADLAASTAISWDHAISGPESVPVIVTRAEGSAPSFEEICSWYAERPRDPRFHDDFLDEQALSKDRRLEFIDGTEFEVRDEYGQGFVRNYAVATTSGFALYVTTSRGYRRVEQRFGPDERDHLTDSFAERCLAIRNAADVVGMTPLTRADFTADLYLPTAQNDDH